jgi:hypothetical protein
MRECKDSLIEGPSKTEGSSMAAAIVISTILSLISSIGV